MIYHSNGIVANSDTLHFCVCQCFVHNGKRPHLLIGTLSITGGRLNSFRFSSSVLLCPLRVPSLRLSPGTDASANIRITRAFLAP